MLKECTYESEECKRESDDRSWEFKGLDFY